MDREKAGQLEACMVGEKVHYEVAVMVIPTAARSDELLVALLAVVLVEGKVAC